MCVDFFACLCISLFPFSFEFYLFLLTCFLRFKSENFYTACKVPLNASRSVVKDAERSISVVYTRPNNPSEFLDLTGKFGGCGLMAS